MRKSDIIFNLAKQEDQMYEELALIELSLWFGLPAWIANATPVLLGGGRPIDGGKLFCDGRRILGNGKTIRGFVSGVVFGILTGTAQWFFAPAIRLLMAHFVNVTTEMEIVLFMNIPTAAALSVGALVGDIIGSFIKRRIAIKSGGPAPVMDQLGFIVMALIFASPMAQPAAEYVIVLIIITLLVHYLSSIGGYVLGWKNHPW